MNILINWVILVQESFDLYNKKLKKEKENDESLFKKIIFSYVIKALLVISLFLISLIYIRGSSTNKTNFKNFVYTNSLSFAKIYNVYNKYLGDVIPFKNTKEKEVSMVSDEKITYTNITKNGNGYLLEVSNNYTVFSLKSGIVIESKKEDNKTLIKVQDKQGLEITYKLLDDVNVKLYDYVKKGEIIGRADKKLYIEFKKDDKYLSYEEYL